MGSAYEQPPPIRLAVLGDRGVGKRRFIEQVLRRRPLENRIDGQYDETLMCRHAAHGLPASGCLCAPIPRLVRPAGWQGSRRAGFCEALFDTHWLHYRLLGGGVLRFVCEHLSQGTAHESKCGRLVQEKLRSVDAAIIMFDCASRSTYANVPNYFRDLRRESPNIPIVLVGTGIEAPDGDAAWRRKVKQRHIRFHQKKSIPLVEVNLSTGENADEPLRLLAQELEETGLCSMSWPSPETDHHNGVWLHTAPATTSCLPPWQTAASRSPALRTTFAVAFAPANVEALLESESGSGSASDPAARRIHELPMLLRRHAANTAALLRCRRLLAFATVLVSACDRECPAGLLPTELVESTCWEVGLDGPATIDFARPAENEGDATNELYGPENFFDEDL
eukprot:COSAG02_NODE_1717_length_11210_cov_6.149401_4_plen_394_part_00